MKNLEDIAERAHQSFEARSQARDKALLQARQLTRHAANAIRAAHRSEQAEVGSQLQIASEIVASLTRDLSDHPDLYYAGYTQDAIKEYVEANITVALIRNENVPSPEELKVEYATYLNGLAEAAGELRRRCLDILRQGYSQEAERLLGCMDDIYSVLVTMDYPDAITNGLRRQTDLVRGVTERTRGDLTLSIREEQLKQTMTALIDRLDRLEGEDAPDSRL
ncbi:MAG TPA: haloacid dehalogenase [Levilinea sp.]|nr:haloacid dehalogenase [Levilinea sp.]